MNQPRGRSALFWILLVVGGSCGLCTVSTLGLMALGLVEGDGVKSNTLAPSVAMPTGNTPLLFPGMPGWLPSGRGVTIPEARVVDGRPEGLWWHWQSTSESKMNAGIVLFLADGTCATNPRPGGGLLFDLEGQRAQRGTTGVGTFEVTDGKLVQHSDRFSSAEPFEETSEGFSLGPQKHMPLRAPTQSGLVGTWSTPGGKFTFRDDGTYESGLVAVDGTYTLAAGSKGTWWLDGYLVRISPTGAAPWITFIGATGDDFLVMGATLYNRK